MDKYLTGRIIKNVLSNKKRKELIKDCHPFLLSADDLTKRMGVYYKSKQTLDISSKSPFRFVIKYMVELVEKETKLKLMYDNCWINLSQGKKEEIMWHNHKGYDFALVYYIKTLPFFNNGTLFRNGFIKAPQNSLLLFPANLEHTAPSCPFRSERYTLSMNLNIVR